MENFTIQKKSNFKKKSTYLFNILKYLLKIKKKQMIDTESLEFKHLLNFFSDDNFREYLERLNSQVGYSKLELAYKIQSNLFKIVKGVIYFLNKQFVNRV